MNARSLPMMWHHFHTPNSTGHYDCDCSEGYYINGNWGDTSNMWVIFTDNVDSGERGKGGYWDNIQHSNHAACWMR